MILRIKTTDFDHNFSGYAYGREHNKELDRYINLFKTNEDIRYFQIESTYNDLEIHQIAYISEQLKDCKMFTRVNLDTDGCYKKAIYVLCFVKQKKDKESEVDKK